MWSATRACSLRRGRTTGPRSLRTMPEPKPTCPSCGERGRVVSMTTVRALSTTTFDDGASVWFCETTTCAVVYYVEDGGHVEKSELRVAVFQKETDPARPVCYCFEHSVRDVLDAERGDGTNPIVEAITSACRAGLDRCEETNPQGRCCLGNVRGLLRGRSAPDCCGGS